MRVRLSAEAAELEAATAWYDNQRPGLGLVFIDAVDAAIRVVAEWPESGSPIPTIAGRLGVRRVPSVDSHTTFRTWVSMTMSGCWLSHTIVAGRATGPHECEVADAGLAEQVPPRYLKVS